jgi:copper chaperone CopZ
MLLDLEILKFKKCEKVSDDAIRDAIDDAGYNLESIE